MMKKIWFYVLVMPLLAFAGLCIVAVAIGSAILSPKQTGSIMREYLEEIREARAKANLN